MIHYFVYFLEHFFGQSISVNLVVHGKNARKNALWKCQFHHLFESSSGCHEIVVHTQEGKCNYMVHCNDGMDHHVRMWNFGKRSCTVNSCTDYLNFSKKIVSWQLNEISIPSENVNILQATKFNSSIFQQFSQQQYNKIKLRCKTWYRDEKLCALFDETIWCREFSHQKCFQLNNN